jgi:hypothetical protein
MSIVQTGDLHVYVADLVAQQIWIAFAAKTGVAGPPMAYDRSYIKLDLKVTTHNDGPGHLNATTAQAPNEYIGRSFLFLLTTIA